MPFDYTRVQWSTGTFEVVVTIILSSMKIAGDPDTPGYIGQITIAEWNGEQY